MSLRGGLLLFPTKQPHVNEETASAKPRVPRSDIEKVEFLYMAVGKQYCVYIMTNAHNTVLYTGVTNNLPRRVYEHRNGMGGIFTRKYNVVKLVYYEITDYVHSALAREKQIKGGSRKKKIDLINNMNPDWKDLYEEII